MTNVTIAYINKQGTVKIPILLKPSLPELLGLNLNITLTALFWAAKMSFIVGEEPPKIIPYSSCD
jgi:hypothetical protein